MLFDYIGLSFLLKLIIVDVIIVFFGVLIIIMVCCYCFKVLSYVWYINFSILELYFLKECIKLYFNVLKSDICKSEMLISKYWKLNKINIFYY